MATYKNNGGELILPTLFDGDGNVLTVPAGGTFDAPDGLQILGVELSKPSKSKTESVDN
jgi:hypothetical protein